MVKYENGATYFAHWNALGSTSIVTDVTGAVEEDQLFYPWGPAWQQTGTMAWGTFAGYEQIESGTASLYPTLFRKYSNLQGRWLSPDPLGGDITDPQSLNRYAYVLNSPASFVDPLGLDCWTELVEVPYAPPVAVVHCDQPAGGSAAGAAGGLGCSGAPTFLGPGGGGCRGGRGPGPIATLPKPNPPAPPAKPPGLGGAPNNLLGPSLRQPGESALACTDRVQKALLGETGAEALGAVSGFALFSSALTLRVGGLTAAGSVPGTNVINTRIGTSVADLIAEGGA